MARLPTPLMVENLRFTGNATLAFTVKWESDHSQASDIDHIRVRFLMTNLFALGPSDEAIMETMESWEDLDIMGTGAQLSLASVEPIPTMDGEVWSFGLGVFHRIDFRSDSVEGEIDNGVAPDDNIHEEEFEVTDPSFQQRFVRLIAQARTPE